MMFFPLTVFCGIASLHHEEDDLDVGDDTMHGNGAGGSYSEQPAAIQFEGI